MWQVVFKNENVRICSAQLNIAMKMARFGEIGLWLKKRTTNSPKSSHLRGEDGLFFRNRVLINFEEDLFSGEWVVIKMKNNRFTQIKPSSPCRSGVVGEQQAFSF